jgi:flagellin-specific chaperone FliS
MVILGKSKEELQKNLNLLYDFCSKWGLEVNTEKTKIMVLKK